MKNWRRRWEIAMAGVGAAMVLAAACGSPDRGMKSQEAAVSDAANEKLAVNGESADREAATEELADREAATEGLPVNGESADKEVPVSGAVTEETAAKNLGSDVESKPGLLENASPDTSALTLFYYDGETVTRRMLFDSEKEKAILQKINELPYETADISQLENWQVPCYGLEIGDEEWGYIVAYAGGLWLNRNREVYAVSVDFPSIWDEVGNEYEEVSPFYGFCNGSILSKYDQRFRVESQVDEAVESNVTLTVTGITDGIATAVLDNQSGEVKMYGEDYCLEKKIDGKWYELYIEDTTVNYDVSCVGICFADSEQHTVKCDLNIYGKLEAGEYRLIKSGCPDSDEVPNAEDEDWIGEFSLDEEGKLK